MEVRSGLSMVVKCNLSSLMFSEDVPPVSYQLVTELLSTKNLRKDVDIAILELKRRNLSLLTRLFLPVGTLWPNYENWFLLESKAQELIAHFRGSFSYTSVKTKLDRCMKMCFICMSICIQIKLF